MSSFYVRFESKDDLELLTRLVGNTAQRIKSNPSVYSDIAEPIFRLVDSLNSAAPLKDAHLLGVPDKILDEDKAKQPPPKPRAPRGSRQKAAALALCETHTTYQAKQVPRTACEGCWAAYKRFNPNKYTAARRKFDRKQAAKA